MSIKMKLVLALLLALLPINAHAVSDVPFDTVAFGSLPSATTYGAGTTVIVTGALANSQPCLAGSSTTIAISTGSAWNCGDQSLLTGAPAWANYFGSGADSTGPASGALTTGNGGEKNFTSWTCTGAITVAAHTSVIVRSQGTVALNTGCSISTSAANNGPGDLGGAGGSGGSGAANSSAAGNTGGSSSNATAGAVSSVHSISTGGGASSSSAGSTGVAITAVEAQMAFAIGYPYNAIGGGIGTAGGSSGGAAGNGGGVIIIIAPTITIASGVTLDASGGPGVATTANSVGSGGGGGGGFIWLLSRSFTDSGAIYKYGGGPGGAVAQPSIQATGGGCDTTGCGTGAVFTTTGVTTGGLDAAKITITNAGTGYKTAPTCQVNAGTSSLVGSPACHFTLSGTTIGTVVIDTAGSGATFTAFTTAFIGGYGANGVYVQKLIQ